MRYVLIPSAKLISKELQSIGKLPPVVYPLTDSKVVFDFIYDTYSDEETKFIIIGKENDSKILNIINKKKYKNVELINLDCIKDIGYTVLFGINSIFNNINEDDNLTINFADTVITEKSINWDNDTFLYSDDYVSDKWTFFEHDKTGFKNIIDKENVDLSVFEKKSLFVGTFSISDIKYLKKCLEYEINKESTVDSLYRALEKYKTKNTLKAIKTKNWFDLGHIDKYYNAQLGVKAREFNQVRIDKNRGILTKYSDNKEKFKGEILWYIKLPTQVEYIRPRIFSYSTNFADMHVSMEYYSYHTLHELMIHSDLSRKQWNDIFSIIKFILKDFSKLKLEDNLVVEDLKNMYLDKTIDRLNELKNKYLFKDMFDNNFEINNKTYKSINEIVEIIKYEIPKKLFNVDNFNIIHGDLCFSNILIDNQFSFVKLIDPRGKFGRFDIYGDYRYELAKLIHSIDGKYDYIIEDLFSIEVEHNSINYEIQDNSVFSMYDCFKECFGDEYEVIKEEVEIIQALLFISMVPLHNEDINRQYVMFATGIEILERWVNIRC